MKRVAAKNFRLLWFHLCRISSLNCQQSPLLRPKRALNPPRCSFAMPYNNLYKTLSAMRRFQFLLLWVLMAPVSGFMTNRMDKITFPSSPPGIVYKDDFLIRQTTILSMSSGDKPPQRSKLVGYNDDAFGLIFLTGGILTKDVDFVGTFLVLSSVAAICTSAEIVQDTRLPGVVAVVSLIISPVVASLRATGSLTSLAAPDPIAIGLCTISCVWAFYIWSRETNS